MSFYLSLVHALTIAMRGENKQASILHALQTLTAEGCVLLLCGERGGGRGKRERGREEEDSENKKVDKYKTNE